VKSGWESFKRFWTAEEVPRWFGFSLVVVYLAGLGAVGHFAIEEVRQEGTSYYDWSVRYAVQALSNRLCLPQADGPIEDPSRSSVQRELYQFAGHVPVAELRVIRADGRVVSSLQVNEIGQMLPGRPVWRGSPQKTNVDPWETIVVDEGDDATPGRLMRTPLPWCAARPASPDATSASAGSASIGGVELNAPGFLEVAVPLEPYGTSSLADHAQVLTVILVGMGVLFGLYHCLRAQLRSAARIAGRLHLHADALDENLSSLRIADSLDAVTESWNRLIDLTEHLRQVVQTNEAAAELTAALRASSGSVLAEALHALPDGLVYVTAEPRIAYLNATAARLLGGSEACDGGRSLLEPSGTAVGEQLRAAIRGAQRADGTFEARSLDVDEGDAGPGAGSCYRVQVYPLHGAAHRGEGLAVIRDVSQQLRAEKAREEFVSQVTHELRTPLTNIRAYAETLSSGMFEDPAVVTECYNVITKETRRLGRLVEDILSVSQIEVGSIALQLDAVELKTLLTEGVRDVRGLADEKNIDLQLVLPPKLEPLQADRDKLAVVINNLLGNAVKYTPAQGNVVVGCQFAPQEVVITVKDNGIGVPAQDQARVFERFQRGSQPEVQNEPGTGIGLFTAREIVRCHGGDIELISREGEGSTFLVRLPRARSRATTLSVTAKE